MSLGSIFTFCFIFIRREYRESHTPQAFKYKFIKEAYQKVHKIKCFSNCYKILTVVYTTLTRNTYKYI